MQLRHLALAAVLMFMLAFAPAAGAAASAESPRPTLVAARPGDVLVSLRGLRLGRSRRYSYGYGYGYGYRPPRHSLLHRAVKTAMWLYVLHLFFTHGGLSVLLWIVLIGFVLSLVRRRRSRYSYRAESRWR
ncbi:MAG: hypothetical protein ACJ780_01905 [Solirubrobacteraceae bacterium]